MAERNRQDIFLPVSVPARVTSLKVEVGSRIQTGTLVAMYTLSDPATSGQDELCLRATVSGRVSSIFCKEGATIQPNEPVCNVEVRCDHSIVVFDMCADCGQDLRRRSSSSADHFAQPESDVRVIHGMPELRVSQKEAEALGKKDYMQLLCSRKLALIVDLDQTLVHTSMDPNIEPGLPDVYGFHLPDHPLLYHCRLRPFTRDFLARVAKLYELHVFTMGTKTYAASVTNILDPEHRYFSDRIISRDECFDPHSKALRLKSLFPCGDSLVAIIDDREDVWGRSPNLIHVKPYLFFAGTADINAPHSSHHSRRRPGRPRPQHRRGAGKGYSLSNPLPFKTRHVVRQAVKNVVAKAHCVAGRIPPGAAEPCVEGEGIKAAGVEREERSESSERLPGLSQDLHQDAVEVGNDDAESRDSSMQTDAGVVSITNVSSERSGDGVVPGGDGVLPGDEQEDIQRANQIDIVSEHHGDCQDQREVGNGGGREGVGEGQVNYSASTEEARGSETTVADMSVEELVNDQDNDPLSATTTQTSSIPTSEIFPDSSCNNNNNNNNNSNDTTGDGTTKNADGSDSDSSSDTSSSSSSSGIDDTLFDGAAHDAGDEGEGGNEGSVVSGGQNGIPETSEASSTTSSTAVTSSDVGVSPKILAAGSKPSAPGSKPAAPGSKPSAPPPTPKPVVEIKDPDTFLLQLADILERVHTIFYKQYDNTATSEKEYVIPDLKQIIPELRHSILRNCRILFTGVIPTNAPPRKNAEWRTARAFGATIHTELVPGLDSCNKDDTSSATTHVIAGKPGTTKLQEASRLPGVKIVNTNWLWACAEQWKKVDEAEYMFNVPKGKKRRGDRGNGPPCKKKNVAEAVSSENPPKGGQAEVPSVEGLRGSLDESADPSFPLAGEEDSDSGSCNSDDDEIFKNSAALTSLAKMDTTELKRHLSMESRLSVSDEELVRMEAEVEAEISESSSSSSNGGDEEDLGSQVELLENNEELSYENFAGTDDSDDLDSVMQERRKRKLDNVEGSSSSESEVPAVDSCLNESMISDEDLRASKSGEEEEDELSKLLGF